MAYADREVFWATLLTAFSILNWLMSVVILGLSVGTVQNSVFSLGVWSFLKPLWDIACADIAAAAFVFVACLATCATVYKRTKPLILINLWGSGLLMCFTFAVGITTLVLAAEKNPALKQLTILVCLSTWGARPNTSVSYNPFTNAWASNIHNGNGIIAEDTLEDMTQLVPFGLNIFKPQVVAKGYHDCNYFDDLMTPCGALLIIVAKIYIFKVFVSYKLYTKIGREDARRNSRFHKQARQPEV